MDFTEIASASKTKEEAAPQPIKNKLTERDLLRICIENPKYLGKALGHDQNEGSGLTTLQQ